MLKIILRASGPGELGKPETLPAPKAPSPEAGFFPNGAPGGAASRRPHLAAGSLGPPPPPVPSRAWGERRAGAGAGAGRGAGGRGAAGSGVPAAEPKIKRSATWRRRAGWATARSEAPAGCGRWGSPCPPPQPPPPGGRRRGAEEPRSFGCFLRGAAGLNPSPGWAGLGPGPEPPVWLVPEPLASGDAGGGGLGSPGPAPGPPARALLAHHRRRLRRPPHTFPQARLHLPARWWGGGGGGGACCKLSSRPVRVFLAQTGFLSSHQDGETPGNGDKAKRHQEGQLRPGPPCLR